MSGDGPPNPSGDAPGEQPHESPHQLVPPRLSDLEAYRLLVRLGHTTHQLSARCWSTAAATALAAAAKVLRALASALSRANIADKFLQGGPD